MEILNIKQMLEGEEMDGENGVSIPNGKQTAGDLVYKSHILRPLKSSRLTEHRIQVKGTEYLEVRPRDTNKTM